MGRMCLINDCNCNEHGPAPCCLDCSERDRCPDRCQKKETAYCVGVIETNDTDKNRTIKEQSIIH
jgi:hypothetical protein